jgi:Protein of unknown function (DUF2867)
MPQLSTQEFERLPLRVHTFLTGVPLHDVWSVDLPRWRAGVTLDDFQRTAGNCLCTPPWLVRMLLDIRFSVGWFFGWDHEPAPTAWKTLRNPSYRDRSFEITGRSRHARWIFPRRLPLRKRAARRVDQSDSSRSALSALVETATAYRFYLVVYVRSVSRFTPFYMALIDPFRKLIVYPSLLRSLRARWNQAFGSN